MVVKRRNLSGIYILEKFEGEHASSPTCIEECKEETLDKWLETLNREALIRTVKYLAETIKLLGDSFNIEAGEPE